ncbi:lysine--tRNA ligase [Candidatus Roizmanbacteria bacterium CG_4_10_14_0_8_um_filter_33_9]|uniref:Lysine--tRNA ligase n=1 Tax=Candidatus Roizmanbacteria bacterium CG_4_10_14_0_8_um_filter_33_9 TaxID=1974826 RepID=A0A2M7QIR5_9BACT|nr:MAG: lysine--tRNA ligase [Candidatus Roizmanbacteria bacterium CG_4_10_14_0_8_um_filter_33_9]
MIWVDREIKKLKERALPLEWVNDAKTPSGKIHVGSLRGIVIHDLIYKVLLENNIRCKFTYGFDETDPMDSLPSYLDKAKWEKYMGMPLYMIPSPEKRFKSFAHYYASEFQQVFESLGCHPKIIWASELYRSGKMNEVIKTLLDNTHQIREIFERITKKSKPADWHPFQPICEKCHKVGTTYVNKWDGKYVYYICQPNMVNWAHGCGYESKISPYNGNGKMPYKIEWPGKWKVLGVTIEWSGKDHMSKGGSYDISSIIAKEILKINPPHAVGYEHLLIGGRKMSSSKGIGSSAKEVSQIIPANLLRFLLVRTPINTHLDFNIYGDTLPNLYDDYDRCMNAYFDKIEKKIPQGKPGEVLLDFARIFELSSVQQLPKKRMFIPRFRTVANLIKIHANPKEHVLNQLKRPLTENEKTLLEERIKFAQIYLESYIENKNILQKSKTDSFSYTTSQKDFLTVLHKNLASLKEINREIIQNIFFTTIKQVNLKPKDVFIAFYQKITGLPSGPKVADLILDLGLQKVISLLSESEKESSKTSSVTKSIPNLDDKFLFSIDPEVKKKYPSISIGFAILKNVHIQKQNEKLTESIQQFVKSQEHLTNDIISAYPEIVSYRKLYKEMNIDWHSRRPSPEALLRRIAKKKPLYQVNTCVDAYNQIVMKYKVSVGAFDLNKIQFPTALKFPKNTDQILLLGDTEPTTYKSTELAYFDKKGGYNIDFNYRDAQRTMVTESTTNLLINVDGIYKINRGMVEQSLQETVDIIIKYCGGTVDKIGIDT